MGLIYVTHKSENGKKQTNDVRINEAFINNILRQKKMISSENTSQGLCKSEHVSSENISHNKPINKPNEKRIGQNQFDKENKDLTLEEFKSFSKYKTIRLMNDRLIYAKVDDWLMKGEITDTEVNS